MDSQSRQINHKVMRVIVGVIALSLSPAVYLLSGCADELSSISSSYWTDARDVFVGSLIAVGFFLAGYNGSGNGRDWEYYLSKAACLFAICIALFPTKSSSSDDLVAGWIASISGYFGLTSGQIHYAAAVSLFVCLVALMWFFSEHAREKGKAGRSGFYRAISILMGGGILVIYLVGSLLEIDNIVFWVEIWGLSFFGVGWLVAGSYRSEVLPDHYVEDKASISI